MRLVKGAYWDSEIKRAQERGLASYPVFTRKANTDVSYLACAQLLASATDVIFPQFATHNAHTVAYIIELFRKRPGEFEFQRLHGMGEELYAQVIAGPAGGYPCRVYAPVGPHEDLLPYLVRRLLETGANTSAFVNQRRRRTAAGERRRRRSRRGGRSPRADRPSADRSAAAPVRRRACELSLGVNFADAAELGKLKSACEAAAAAPWRATALINGRAGSGARLELVNPADESQLIPVQSCKPPPPMSSAHSRARAPQPGSRGGAQCRGARRDS